MFLIRWEKRLEQFFRDTTANGTPVLLFWLLPSGRFLLWMLAMMCLANLVSTVPPLPLHFELYDLGLILYLAGIIKGELTEMHGDVRTYGHLRRCARSARRVSCPPQRHSSPHQKRARRACKRSARRVSCPPQRHSSPHQKRARGACECSVWRAPLPGRYLTDAFNVLDMLLVILLGTLITARHVHVIDPSLPFAYAELPAQVMTTDDL